MYATECFKILENYCSWDRLDRITVIPGKAKELMEDAEEGQQKRINTLSDMITSVNTEIEDLYGKNSGRNLYHAHWDLYAELDSLHKEKLRETDLVNKLRFYKQIDPIIILNLACLGFLRERAEFLLKKEDVLFDIEKCRRSLELAESIHKSHLSFSDQVRKSISIAISKNNIIMYTHRRKIRNGCTQIPVEKSQGMIDTAQKRLEFLRTIYASETEIADKLPPQSNRKHKNLPGHNSSPSIDQTT